MVKWFFLLLLSTSCFATEMRSRVVVLDTGLSLEDPRFSELLCQDYPGIDFTEEGIKDIHGHGTHVTGIIKQFAKDSQYCLTILKYYSTKQSNKDSLKAIVSSLKFISWLKPKVVNWSGGGETWNDDEYYYIKNTPETTFVVAVGNDNANLDEHCNYYPACYKLPNIIRIGSLKQDGKIKADSSNFGNIVNFFEIGENILSTLPIGYGTMSGTSLSNGYIHRKIYL